ncbi:D-alanyl-D-alanine carboxypeptidase/D-alanyl-D-alanine-endopeptidase [Bifidobacterium aerophilum]|uniref:D-alanyl-D-alanine carboxypeptidase n=1 Tax=Bifidobacterium aerophilum TaxID=1798155 RepID=A0A6N9Z3V5_9BIFI|nr:D-alanyl-D-alanine carboxypeptidase [Bifidobacterium aerophilum]NEG88895.1 D-alanyl-D-alanine carboxypeptidase [Bifidobacterium aerophilum]
MTADDRQRAADRARMRRRRAVRVAIAALATVALGCGYLIADITDALPGPLTLRPVERRTIPAALTSRKAGTIAGDAATDKPIDTSAAQSLIRTFAATKGVGDHYSVAIATADGTVVASASADTPREPASTMKTLTALAASATLDMGSTLDTDVYLTDIDATDGTGTLILRGNGDMLLSAGDSDPDHVNGRAGLGTLAARTAKALRQRGIDTVTLMADDSLFGADRYPDDIAANNPGNLYYTGVSSMAVDGGRQWDGAGPANPDVFSAYPELSQTTAADAAATFAKRLAEQGVTVSNQTIDVSERERATATDGLTPIASVESATLAEILAFAMRHSDNTLAEEFGRLTALAAGEANSPQGATTAVRNALTKLGIDTTGLTMADCSGLSPGSKVSVKTLVAVQTRNLTAGGEAAAAEGLSIPGLIGTAANRAVSEDTAGLLRVKTGSLDEVTSMAGNVSRLDGGTLAFAVIVNKPDDWSAARGAIDVFVDGLARL